MAEEQFSPGEKQPEKDTAPRPGMGERPSGLRQALRFLASMKMAVFLLILLAAACALASTIPQGQPASWYTRQYGERTAGWILALRLDDAFHSGWFIVMTAFLCLNLIFCNLTRIRPLIRRFRAEKDPLSAGKAGEGLVFPGVEAPERVLKHLNMPGPISSRTAEERELLFSSRNRLGIWGAWVCHLGILLLILGFGLGQMTKEEGTVYGVPGDTRALEGTGLFVTIDDFRADLREDDTVEQYTTDLTVYELEHSSESRSASISVNHPAYFFGRSFYQNSTGWAARVRVTENGEPLMDQVLCAGDGLAVTDKPDLTVMFHAFYPDYVFMEGKGPQTASSEIRNPAYLYAAYYQGNMLGMNVLMGDEPLTIDEYEFRFSDPQLFTLIAVKKDDWSGLAFLGAAVTLLGLILAFYVIPRKVWAIREADGSWTVYGSCRKGEALFREQMKEAVEKEGNHAAG